MKIRRLADYIALVLLISGAFYLIQYFGFSKSMEGRVIVVDGDSLRLYGDDIRLYGIDAPEFEQTCQMTNGKPYNCGRKAQNYLRKLIAGRHVICKSTAVDRYDRDIAVCKAGETELNLAMIKGGWAISYRGLSLTYARAELQARQAKRGLWQGTFVEPHDWRAEQR